MTSTGSTKGGDMYSRYPLLPYRRGARKEGKLSIISNIEDRNMRGIIEEFSKRYPFIKVTHIFLIPGQFQGRLEAEYRGGKITFDIAIPACPSPQLIWLLNNSLLISYKSPLADKVPKDMIVGNYQAYAIASGTAFVIAYNKNLVPRDKIPKSIVDIANDPFWKGRFGIGDPRIGGATWTMYYLLYQMYGIDLFNKLAQQGIRVSSATDVAARVSSGDLYAGVTWDYFVLPRKLGGEPVDFIYPQDPIIPLIYCAGILRDADHPNAAKLFIDFLLSEEGQKAVVQRGLMWNPIYKDLKPSSDIPNMWSMPNLRIYPPGNYDLYRPVLEEFRMNATLGKIVSALGIAR